MTQIILSTFPVNHQVTGFSIEVDVPKGLLDMRTFNKKLPKALKNIAKEAKSFWESEAGRKLKTARVKYREGIKIDVIDNTTIVLSMSDFGATLEKSKAFDMKIGFMNSGKVTGRLKLPKHVAMNLPKLRNQPPRRFLIIPMRWYMKNESGKLTKFRTVTDKSPMHSWMWARKNGGVGRDLDISREVVKEMETNIIPKHMKALIEEVWRGV